MRRVPPLSQAALRIKPAAFADLQSRIDAATARGEDLVPLQIGDTHLLPPVAARRALAAQQPDDASLFRYGPTAGLPELRNVLAERLREGGLDLDPAVEILVGNGATHALYCAARAVLDSGDEVLLSAPYWPLASGIFSACGAFPVEVPLTSRLYDDQATDPADVLRAFVGPRTKAIYFVSPNNPDGKVWARRDLERVADLAREHDLWVFADEVYADTVFEGEHVSIATLPGMRERTVVLSSVSKSRALAGLRVGFVGAPEPVIATARRVSTHTAFNVPVAMQRAAHAALLDRDFPNEARRVYRAARDAGYERLTGAGIEVHRPEGATYFFVDLAPVLAETGATLLAVLARAVDRGVLVTPGSAFGEAFGSWARLCFTSVPEDRMLVGIDRLLEAIDDLRRKPSEKPR